MPNVLLKKSGEITPLISSSILGTYRPGEFIFQCPIFLPSYGSWGSLEKEMATPSQSQTRYSLQKSDDSQSSFSGSETLPPSDPLSKFYHGNRFFVVVVVVFKDRKCLKVIFIRSKMEMAFSLCSQSH